MIDPKETQRNEAPPPVVIEQVIADDRIVFGDGCEEKKGVKGKGRGEPPPATSPLDTRHSTLYLSSFLQILRLHLRDQFLRKIVQFDRQDAQCVYQPVVSKHRRNSHEQSCHRCD